MRIGSAVAVTAAALAGFAALAGPAGAAPRLAVLRRPLRPPRLAGKVAAITRQPGRRQPATAGRVFPVAIR